MHRSWNYFGNNVNETLIKQTAGALVATGLRDLGFNYVHLDAGVLSPHRGPAGELLENRTLFPSGIASLATWLHARSLKLGVYTDIGNYCSSRRTSDICCSSASTKT